jgi:hypothetical protein
MPELHQQKSLQSYAYQLRKKLLVGAPLNQLLDTHRQHQRFLEKISPELDFPQLTLSERFAWKFLREINILNLQFSKPNQGKTDKLTVGARGVHQDLLPVVQSVQEIWFPEMTDLPNVGWLKKFSTRKLAHYAQNNDEIAISLIFDFLDVPAEILSYLAYHELLHRQLGTRRVNGRRYAHTSDFKNQEHLFPNWRDIDALLERYILTACSV